MTTALHVLLAALIWFAAAALFMGGGLLIAATHVAVRDALARSRQADEEDPS